MQDQVLPADFDGTFRFTNWTQEDFEAKWGGVTYKFPALKTVPMIMPFSPAEIQHIRKVFAKKLAEREFLQSDSFKRLDSQNRDKDGMPKANFNSAIGYSDNELKGYIQKCLEPLPLGKIEVKVEPTDGSKRQFHTDDEGKPKTRVLKAKISGDSTDESLINGGEVIG